MMRIALVYDLRDEYRALGYSEEEIAEFDSVGTIEALASAIETLGCEPVRVGRGQALAARLVAGERFDLVFSIAEGLKGRARRRFRRCASSSISLICSPTRSPPPPPSTRV